MKVDLFAPMLCAICRENVVYDEFPVCTDCLQKLQQLFTKRCRVCGKPATGCECGGSSAVRALFFYGGPLSKRIMYMLKYNADRRAVDFFVRLAIAACGVSGCDGVAYVPRDSRRRRKYGFDQSKELAAAAARTLGVPLVSVLARHRGRAQKLLSARERRENMKNRFYIGQELNEQERFRRLLLVDDVCTTGATINACAEILRGSIAKSVTAMCLARTELTK